jgi:hypothetical protein
MIILFNRVELYNEINFTYEIVVAKDVFMMVDAFVTIVFTRSGNKIVAYWECDNVSSMIR